MKFISKNKSLRFFRQTLTVMRELPLPRELCDLIGYHFFESYFTALKDGVDYYYANIFKECPRNIVREKPLHFSFIPKCKNTDQMASYYMHLSAFKTFTDNHLYLRTPAFISCYDNSPLISDRFYFHSIDSDESGDSDSSADFTI